MATAMRNLLGLDQADLAAGMIISDLQVRAANGGSEGLDFAAIARGMREDPPPPEDPPSELTTPRETPHAS